MIILPVANFQLYRHLQRVLNKTPEMNGIYVLFVMKSSEKTTTFLFCNLLGLPAPGVFELKAFLIPTTECFKIQKKCLSDCQITNCDRCNKVQLMSSIAMNCDSANRLSCLLNTATLGLIHLVPNRHPREQGTHLDKTKKEPTSSNCRLFLSSPNAFLALWHGSWRECSLIHYFHRDHNRPCLPPRSMHNHCFQFL